MRLLAQKKSDSTYANLVNQSVMRAAEEALSDASQIGFESANAGLESISYRFVEGLLTEMAYKDALDVVFS